MHLYLVNLFQFNYPLHVPNKPVHHQEVIPVHTANSISHTSMGCLDANRVTVPADDELVCSKGVEGKHREENQLDATESDVWLTVHRNSVWIRKTN